MMKASEHRYLTGIGKPLVDIRSKYSARAFSSDGVRYCWYVAFSYIEGRLCARYHRVVQGILLDSDRAVYVLGCEGLRPLDNTLLAGSILRR
jgi:hypothetical protein